MLTPPRSIMGPLTNAEYIALTQSSAMTKKYQETIDPESAYEILTNRINEKQAAQETEIQQEETPKKEKRVWLNKLWVQL